MRRFVLFLLCLSVPLYGLRVAKIKVIGNTHTKEAIIREMSSDLNTRTVYSAKELKQLAHRVEERLINTTWFYVAHVYVAPTKKGADYRNIIIEVQDGFLWRFNGGYAYGSVGMDNIWGNGEEILLSMGMNRQNIDFALPNFLSYIVPHVYLRGNAGNVNGYYDSYTTNYVKNETQRVGANLETGYRFNWDTSLALRAGYNKVYTDSYVHLLDDYYMGLSFLVDKRDANFSATKGYYFRADYTWLQMKDSRFSLELRNYFPILTKSVRFCSRLLFATETPQTQPYYKLSILGIDGVRSSNYPTMIGNTKLLSNLELRWNFLRHTFFGILDTSFDFLGFFDFGNTFSDLATIRDVSLNNYPLAYGVGLRLFFNAPVFVPLRIELGWDKQGKMNGYFGMTSPF